MTIKISTDIALPPKGQARSSLTRTIIKMSVQDVIVVPVPKGVHYTRTASNLYARFKRIGWKMTYRYMRAERHLLVQRIA